jgi:hypothetical protein
MWFFYCLVGRRGTWVKLTAYQIAQRIWYVLVVCGSILFFYVLSVLWRVSVAEQEIYGRSCIVPLSWHPPAYSEPPVADSYGQGTYTHEYNGKVMHVHKQLINGFQHGYGSALVSYEVGEKVANALFHLNEYVEAFDGSSSNTLKYNLDTRKDLANNVIGIRIGQETRAKHLFGQAAQKFMIAEALAAMDRDEILKHYLDPRVKDLPSVEAYGCPGLPTPTDQ